MSRTPIHRRLPLLATGAALLALGLGGLTACGGSSSGSNSAASASAPAATSSSAAATASSASGSSSEAEALTATETNFAIKLGEDHIKAGTYTITVVNDGQATHNLAIEQNGTVKATSPSIGPGGKTTLTIDLTPGQYVFYCAIGNHRALGMQTDVTVS